MICRVQRGSLEATPSTATFAGEIDATGSASTNSSWLSGIVFLHLLGIASNGLSVALTELGNETSSFLLISQGIFLDLNVVEPS